MDSPKAVLDDAATRMQASLEKLGGDFSTIRTGRANAKVLDRVTVEYYGTRTPLNQLANFSVPEPRMLIVSPYDRSAVNDVEKAIRDSDLGLNPASDGAVIRLVFPELTEERRNDYVKMARTYAEEGRIAIRNVRRQARDELQRMEDDGEVGADEQDRAAKQLEELTSTAVAKVDAALDAKEKELMEV